ncbi:MAG: mononuclear molybdenum enzyme YedY, partial [Gemmatimonadales bacterium]
MLIRRPPDVPSSEITPESVYLRRREFITRAGGIGLGLAGLSLMGGAACDAGEARTARTSEGEVGNELPSEPDKLNSYEDITS